MKPAVRDPRRQTTAGRGQQLGIYWNATKSKIVQGMAEIRFGIETVTAII